MAKEALLEKGLGYLKRAHELDRDAGDSSKSIPFYNLGIECFEKVINFVSDKPSEGEKKLLTDKICEFRARVSEIENDISLRELQDSLPAPPSLVPTTPAAKEAEAKARKLLKAAIEMDSDKRVEIGPALEGAYMAAAEAAVSALKLSVEGTPAWVAMQQQAALSLDRIECLRSAVAAAAASAAAPQNPSAPQRSPTKTPQSFNKKSLPLKSPRAGSDSLTRAEIDVLKASSFINGKLFMPWLEGEDKSEIFTFPAPWTDLDGPLPLSEKQRRKLVGGGLMRPTEFLALKARTAGTAPVVPSMIKCVTPYSITQDTIADCSFVASLCIASAFERRFEKQLITSIVYPQNASGLPVYNPSGKYMVKLWVNGVLRKVVVDDYLPVGEGGRLLCSASSDASELWVSIIEKAYMKVNGGYNFPGSNSGIDLFALTGWLPEQVFFEEHRKGNSIPTPIDSYQPAERVWSRILSAHTFGDCLITVATEGADKLTKEEAKRLGLVEGHAYAVLDVREVLGVRLLQVKNPWARHRWRGPYSDDDRIHWTPAMKAALQYDPEEAQRSDNGVFWIDWGSITSYFRNVFLNWNPSLFSYRTVLHSEWPVTQGPPNDSFNLGMNPQYSLVVQYPQGGMNKLTKGIPITATATPTVWVLLSRHVMDVETDDADGDYLTLHVYSGPGGGGRVYYPDKLMYKGIYSNNPHTLVRFDLPERPHGAAGASAKYTLILSQFKKHKDVRYTLNVYCTADFALLHTPLMPEQVIRVRGSWEDENAGGGMGLPTFYKNPQFLLRIPEHEGARSPAFAGVPIPALHIQLEAPMIYSVAFSLIRRDENDQGGRVDTVVHSQEVLTTGSYRSGFCYASLDVLPPPGLYTIIVSTYKAGEKGLFVLTVASSIPLPELEPVPPEGHGMACHRIEGMWSFANGTAVGCSNYNRYTSNPKYSISLSRRKTLILRLVLGPDAGPFPNGRPALNVAVYPATPEGGLAPKSRPIPDRSLATSNSGVYTDSLSGACIRAFSLDAGIYIVVPSTFEPVEAPFVLTIYSDPPLPYPPWEV